MYGKGAELGRRRRQHEGDAHELHSGLEEHHQDPGAPGLDSEDWDRRRQVPKPRIPAVLMSGATRLTGHLPSSSQDDNAHRSGRRGGGREEREIPHGGGGQRVSLSLEKKVELITTAEEQGKSIRALAAHFQVSRSAIQRLLKRKAEYLEDYARNFDKDSRRKVTKSPADVINHLTGKWYQAAKAKGLPVSGPVIQKQALFFANKVGNTEFKASNGWLESFKKRHNISQKAVHSLSQQPPSSFPGSPMAGLRGGRREENGGREKDAMGSWRQRLSLLMRHYQKRDVFSLTETALHYDDLPIHTVLQASEKARLAAGSQRTASLSVATSAASSTSRKVTLLICCNFAGEKEPVAVVNNVYKPRRFRHLDRGTFPGCLPVAWYANKHAAVTQNIFNDWLENFEREMERQKRDVLLFVDNNVAHSGVSCISLKHVKMVYFPSELHPEHYPLHQGAVESMKLRYRNKLLSYLLSVIESGGTEELRTHGREEFVDMLKVVHWISKAWDELPSSFLVECYEKSGFRSTEHPAPSGAMDTSLSSSTPSATPPQLPPRYDIRSDPATSDLLDHISHLHQELPDMEVAEPTFENCKIYNDVDRYSAVCALDIANDEGDAETINSQLRQKILEDYLSGHPEGGGGGDENGEEARIRGRYQPPAEDEEEAEYEPNPHARADAENRLRALDASLSSIGQLVTHFEDLASYTLKLGIDGRVAQALLEAQDHLCKHHLQTARRDAVNSPLERPANAGSPVINISRGVLRRIAANSGVAV